MINQVTDWKEGSQKEILIFVSEYLTEFIELKYLITILKKKLIWNFMDQLSGSNSGLGIL